MEEINKLINELNGTEKWQNTFCSITVAILNGVLIIHINISNALVNVMYHIPTFFFLIPGSQFRNVVPCRNPKKASEYFS